MGGGASKNCFQFKIVSQAVLNAQEKLEKIDDFVDGKDNQDLQKVNKNTKGWVLLGKLLASDQHKNPATAKDCAAFRDKVKLSSFLSWIFPS